MKSLSSALLFLLAVLLKFRPDLSLLNLLVHDDVRNILLLLMTKFVLAEQFADVSYRGNISTFDPLHCIMFVRVVACHAIATSSGLVICGGFKQYAS